MGGPDVVRWPVRPYERSQRGLDERLVLAAPWLAPALGRLALSRPAGSRIRRKLFTRAALVGVAANNRRDYVAMGSFIDPEIELHILPDDFTLMGADLDPLYRGYDGYIRSLHDWKLPFEQFRWDVHELIDPGGRRFGARTEMVAVGRDSGIEVRQPSWLLWEMERGLIRRQWVLGSEEALLERV